MAIRIAISGWGEAEEKESKWREIETDGEEDWREQYEK